MNRLCPQIISQQYFEEKKMTGDHHAQHEPGSQSVEPFADNRGLQGHEKRGGEGALVGIPEVMGGLEGSADKPDRQVGLLPYLMGIIAVGIVVRAGMIVPSDIEKRQCGQNQDKNGQKAEPGKSGSLKIAFHKNHL